MSLPPMDLFEILAFLAVFLLLARLGSVVIAKFGIPGLVGEIVIGVVIANLTLGDWSLLGMLNIQLPDYSIGFSGNENYHIFYSLAELGVIFLLFSVGLETRIKDLFSVGKVAMLVAVLGVVIPFILGVAVILVIEHNMIHALFLGAAMVATSVGITASVIKDMKLTDTRESRIIIGAAVIDDILGMLVLAIVAGMDVSGGGVNITSIAITALVAVFFVFLVFVACMKLTPRIYDYMGKRRAAKLASNPDRPVKPVNMLAVAIIVCFALAALSEFIGLAAIIGAFLAGMLFADHSREWKLEPKIEDITVFLLPLFFINVGLQVNVGLFTSVEVLLISAVVLVLAIASKYIGCGLGARLGDKTLDRDGVKIIGMGMVPRGEVGIIVASIGLASGAMSSELYAVVVLMSVVTTIIAPPLLSKLFRKKYPTDKWATTEM